MSSYNELIALINGCINRNGVQAITGRVLNGVLRAMVNQLGAGYAMGGVAHPTDDPGTPDAPVCYYASEVGTYTHFGNIQIVPGELALLCFDLTDGWFKETMYEGFESVQATIDGNVGTPAVNVTYVNGVLSFDFSNMKGNTGAAAGFGNVTAAVDGTIGTPGVSVQTDGPDTAKNIAFQFTGLKGETGVTSVIATVDNTSGTPQCAVSLNGQQLTLAFTGLKGAQGDTGSSVAYPFTIVNNLTTDDATQALSAAQGVVLAGQVSQLEHILDVNSETQTVTKTLVSGTDYTVSDGYCPGTYGDINTNSNFNHSSVLELKAGDVISVKASGPNSIAIIAKKTNATRYDALVTGSAWNVVNDYSYTLTEDLEIVISWQVSNNMPAAIIKVTRTETVTTSAIDDLQTDMSALQTSQTALQSAVNTVKVEVEGNVTDDLTSDLVAGKYITHAGTLVTNASFSYKEFVIRAGAVITLDATIHQNVAAISKKILNSHPNLAEYGFKELVPATSTTPSTFTYTATENMTIAVCFNNTADRSISIVTNEVGANTANINDNINGQENYKKARMLWDIDFGVMFDKIAVIGDSLASGRVEGIVGQPDAAGQDFYNFSWLAYLAKRWRCSAFKNYSNAGADTASWLNDWLPVMQADPVVYDAYFIALGTNNEYNETNPSGDQTNFDNFVSRYNDIIDAVRTKAPNAAIFICSLYEPRVGVGNETLEDIAETRALTDDGVFYVDYVNEANYFRYSAEVNWRGHFSTTGYVYVSSVINQLVNEIVWDNKTEEFWVQFAKYHNGS